MRYKSVLFVTQGLSDDTAALTQTARFLDPSDGQLNGLLLAPPMPEALIGYRKKLQDSLLEQFQQQWRSSCINAERIESSVEVRATVEFEDTPAVRAIAIAIRDAVDLIAKTADDQQGKAGFSSFDLTLLRKSPIPVWLSRGDQNAKPFRRVAVAIDPLVSSKSAHALNIKMLGVARDLAARSGGEFEIVSCWDFIYENDLRRSVWLSIPENEIREAVDEADRLHRSAIEAVIAESGITGGFRLHRLRGKPSTSIPQFVQDEKIDTLVMGTIARTGIKGFIMGNTAESILDALRCNLLAFKPDDFVSPVGHA